MRRLLVAAAITACTVGFGLAACGCDEEPARGDGAPAGATSTPTPDRPDYGY